MKRLVPAQGAGTGSERSERRIPRDAVARNVERDPRFTRRLRRVNRRSPRSGWAAYFFVVPITVAIGLSTDARNNPAIVG